MEGQSATEVRAMFDGISGRYDLLNDLLSLGFQRSWRRRAVDRLGVKRLECVLDLACGTGDFTLALQKRVQVTRMVCADLSGNMLKEAARKFQRCGLHDRVEFVECAAEHMPFPDATFDVVLIGYGVRNFSNLEQSLRECQRVLKPGGRVVILEFGKPRSRWFSWCYHLYLRSVVPVLGGIVSGSFRSYRYLYKSIESFTKSNRLQLCIERSGLEVEKSYARAVGVVTTQYLQRKGNRGDLSEHYR